MAGFTFRLELEDGTLADPTVLHTAVPNWSAGARAAVGRAINFGRAVTGPARSTRGGE
jgi:hypothetical protein